MKTIVEKCSQGTRLEAEELLKLHDEAPLAALGLLAHEARLRKADPKIVTYIVDRNINYTNVCVSGCRFCAFFEPPRRSQSPTHSGGLGERQGITFGQVHGTVGVCGGLAAGV